MYHTPDPDSTLNPEYNPFERTPENNKFADDLTTPAFKDQLSIAAQYLAHAIEAFKRCNMYEAVERFTVELDVFTQNDPDEAQACLYLATLEDVQPRFCMLSAEKWLWDAVVLLRRIGCTGWQRLEVAREEYLQDRVVDANKSLMQYPLLLQQEIGSIPINDHPPQETATELYSHQHLSLQQLQPQPRPWKQPQFPQTQLQHFDGNMGHPETVLSRTTSMPLPPSLQLHTAPRFVEPSSGRHFAPLKTWHTLSAVPSREFATGGKEDPHPVLEANVRCATPPITPRDDHREYPAPKPVVDFVAALEPVIGKDNVTLVEETTSSPVAPPPEAATFSDTTMPANDRKKSKKKWIPLAY